MTRVMIVRMSIDAFDWTQAPNEDIGAVPSRVDAADAAVRAAGFDLVLCELPRSAEAAEQLVRDRLAMTDFPVVLFGGGFRMLPGYTELFEQTVNVIREVSPATSLCFSVQPEDYVDCIRRWQARAGTAADEKVEGIPPSAERILMIRIDPRLLDYSWFTGIDEPTMVARYQAAESAVARAGFHVVPLTVGTSPDRAAADIRARLAADDFSVALIGGSLRVFPEYTELFERIVDLLCRCAPHIRFRFGTSPESVVNALLR